MHVLHFITFCFTSLLYCDILYLEVKTMKNSLKSVRLDDKLLKRLYPVMKKKKMNFSGAVSDALERYVRQRSFQA